MRLVCALWMRIWISLIYFVITGNASGYEDLDGKGCYRSTSCRQLRNTSCLSVTLPYKYTGIGSFNDHSTDETEIRKHLEKWKILQSVPRCWTSLQSLLCTLYLPKCDNDKIYPPSYEMCKTARNNCKFIEMYFSADKVPSFLNCDQEFSRPTCKNVYQDLKFNSSSAKCKYPLVPTENSQKWYPGIEGCGPHCEDPLLSEKERNKLSNFIKNGSGLSTIFTLFCIFTFLIDWKSSNRYPAIIIFYINVCLLFSNAGWLLQFWFTKQEIVCRPDNTSRYGEPNTSGNFSCLLVFFLIYYFSIAALVWFVCLTYLWNPDFQRVTNFKKFVDSKKSYFHLSAWSVPLILTITIIAIGEVDSIPALGICFVGNKPIYRISFLLIPLVLTVVLGSYFSFPSVRVLVVAKSMKRSLLINNKRETEINRMIIKLVSFILYIFFSSFCTIICHFFEHRNSQMWKDALNRLVICSLDIIPTIDPSKSHICIIGFTPSLFYTYLQLCAVFGNGIAVSLWTFTSSSIAAWRRVILRLCRANLSGPVRLKKHEVISKAYPRRNEIFHGCYSPSFQSVHADPIDMNLTSAMSEDLSTTWKNALPYFLLRRGAVTKHTGSNHYLQVFRVKNNNLSMSDMSQHRSSIDSFASNRLSFDSLMSFEQEINAIARHQRRKTKKERERFLRSQKHFSISLRRGSDTSNQSLASGALKNLMKTHKPVTRSTSTGDLHQIPNVISPMQLSMPITMPYVPYTLNSMNYPTLTPTMPLFPRKRPKLLEKHPFTHGMSQQSDFLVNPLLEKRHIDSRMTSNKSNENEDINENLNKSHTFTHTGHSLMPPLNPYFSNNLSIGCINNSFTNYIGFSGTSMTKVPMYTPFYPYNTCQQIAYSNADSNKNSTGALQNLEELQSVVRERETCLPLITGVESSSELEEMLPIHISDSEGFTDGGVGFRSPALNIQTQLLVEKHIQKIEAEAEENEDKDEDKNSS